MERLKNLGNARKKTFFFTSMYICYVFPQSDSFKKMVFQWKLFQIPYQNETSENVCNSQQRLLIHPKSLMTTEKMMKWETRVTIHTTLLLLSKLRKPFIPETRQHTAVSNSDGKVWKAWEYEVDQFIRWFKANWAQLSTFWVGQKKKLDKEF